MTERRRNIAVGLTMLVALGGLAFMILLFGELPAFVRRGYPLTLEFPTTGGMQVGANVHLNGKPVGRVDDIHLKPDPRDGVIFECTIERDVQIPGDVNAYIFGRGLMGGGFLELKSDGQPPGSLRGIEWLPRDGSVVVAGQQKGGLLPDQIISRFDEIAEGFTALKGLADNLNRLVEPMVATQPATGPAATQPRTGLAGTLDRLDQALAGLNAIVGDKENQENIHVMLANLRKASESGAKAMDELTQVAAHARESFKKIDASTESIKATADTARQRVDDVAAELIVEADKLGTLLTTLNQSAAKIEQGQGTLGKLINDPALYNDLVDATRQLQHTLEDLSKAIERWKAEGIPLKIR